MAARPGPVTVGRQHTTVVPVGVATGWAALPAGVACFADSGDLLWVNDALRAMTGHPPDALPPRLADLLTTASRLLYQTGVWPVLLDRLWVEESYLTLRASDGSHVPVIANFRRQIEPGGRLVNVAVVMRMRDRQRLDDELLRARRTSEQVPGLICQFQWRPDRRASVPYASDAIQAMFGVTPAQVRDNARPLWRRVPPPDRADLQASLQRSAERLAPWHHRFRVVVQGRERWIEGRASPQATSGGGVLWHAYLVDVTELRQREELLREKAVAERASQAKSEFLARVSHELRTPLNAVLGFVQLLAGDRELPLNPRQRDHLERIETAGRNLLELVSDVLDLSRIESGVVDVDLQPCTLAPLMHHCAELVAVHARQIGVSLIAEPPGALCVRADARKLTQCLLNLLGNAVKYARPQGWVRLSAHATTTGEVILAVQDNGPGMSAEQQSHLFEPFNRLGAERGGIEGSGLGLVITRGLVERMGGRLEVQSVLGVGSRLTVVLPRGEATQASSVAVEPGSAAKSGSGSEATTAQQVPDPDVADLASATRQGGGPVLYVDDHPVNVMLMQALFERRPGLRLCIASSGEEALAIAAAERPALLLIDIGLPDISGLELLQRLRALPGLAATPAAAVSADAMKTDIDRALQHGFDAYWTKPLDLQRALESLDAWRLTGRLPR